MRKHQLLSILVLFCLFMSTSSCIDDVDFEQGEEFVLLQSNTVSLVSFDIGNEEFDQSSTPGVVSDVTRLEFLAEPVVQEHLNNVTFVFEYNNTYAQSFSNRIVFLTEEDEERYVIAFDVDASLDGREQETLHVEGVPESELENIKESIKVQIELRRNDNGEPVTGNIRLRSRADFILEYGGPSTGN